MKPKKEQIFTGLHLCSCTFSRSEKFFSSNASLQVSSTKHRLTLDFGENPD
jgi:hypothetical protein